MVQHSALSHQFEASRAANPRSATRACRRTAQGENVELNQTIAGAHDALMHSPPHRANILDPDYNVIGVGVIRSR